MFNPATFQGTQNVMPKDYIRAVLINEMTYVVQNHPYLSFNLICTGIEFLGICVDTNCDWTSINLSSKHFKRAIEDLFPDRYRVIRGRLYKELRNGLVHSQMAGSFFLVEVKNNPAGTWTYDNHLVSNQNILVLDYFFFDFKQACLKVIATHFNHSDKMNQPLFTIGPIHDEDASDQSGSLGQWAYGSGSL
jgi:hypothetical protein